MADGMLISRCCQAPVDSRLGGQLPAEEVNQEQFPEGLAETYYGCTRCGRPCLVCKK